MNSSSAVDGGVVTEQGIASQNVPIDENELASESETILIFHDAPSSENFNINELLNNNNSATIVRTTATKASGLQQSVQQIVSNMLFGGSDKSSDSISIASDMTMTDQDILRSMQFKSKSKNTAAQSSSGRNSWKAKSAVKSISGSIYEDTSPVVFSQLGDVSASRKIYSMYKDLLSGTNANKNEQTSWEAIGVDVRSSINQAYNSLEGVVADIFKGLVSSEPSSNLHSIPPNEKPTQTGKNPVSQSSSFYEVPSQEKLVNSLNPEISTEQSIGAGVVSPSSSQVTDSRNHSNSSKISPNLEKRIELRKSISQKPPENSDRVKNLIHSKSQMVRRDSAGEAPLVFQDSSSCLQNDNNSVSPQKNSVLTAEEVGPSLEKSVIHLAYSDLEKMIVKTLGKIMFGENPPNFFPLDENGVPITTIAEESQDFLSSNSAGKLISEQMKLMPQANANQSNLAYQREVSQNSDLLRREMGQSSSTTVDSPTAQNVFDRTVPQSYPEESLNRYTYQQNRLASKNTSSKEFAMKQKPFVPTPSNEMPNVNKFERYEVLPEPSKLGFKHTARKANVSHITNRENSTPSVTRANIPQRTKKQSVVMLSRKVQTVAAEDPSPPAPKNISAIKNISTSHTGESVRRRSISTAMVDDHDQSEIKITPSWYRGLIHEMAPFSSATNVSEGKIDIDTVSTEEKGEDEKVTENLYVRVKVNCPTEPVRILAANISPCLSSANTCSTDYASAVEQSSHSQKEVYRTPLKESLPSISPEDSTLSQKKEYDLPSEEKSDLPEEEVGRSPGLISPPHAENALLLPRADSLSSQVETTFSEEELAAGAMEPSKHSFHAISSEEQSDASDSKEERIEENL